MNYWGLVPKYNAVTVILDCSESHHFWYSPIPIQSPLESSKLINYPTDSRQAGVTNTLSKYEKKYPPRTHRHHRHCHHRYWRMAHTLQPWRWLWLWKLWFPSREKWNPAQLGTFLSVLFAPAYFLGYYFISQNLTPKKKWLKKAFFFLSIYTFSMAMMWVSARSYLALSVNQKLEAPQNAQPFIQNIIDGIGHHADPLLFITWAGLIIISVLFFYLVFTKQSNFPRLFAFINPISILIFIFLIYFFIPHIGVYLIPTAMNIVHVLFFGIGSFLLFRKR